MINDPSEVSTSDNNLDSIIYFLKSKFYLILSLFAVGFILTFLIALTAPNIYKSTVVLAPAQSNYSSGFSGVQSSAFGGLASLVGIESSAEVDSNAIAIKTFESYDFFQFLYSQKDFLEWLYAVKTSDLDGNNVRFDSNLFDVKKNMWNRKPDISSAFKLFHRKHFSHFKDRKSGFIYLHLEHENPFSAYKLGILTNKAINDYIKEQNTSESEKALSYIEDKISTTNSLEVRGVLSRLAERELQILILSEATDQFAFKTIQEAFIPFEKDRPRKSIMVMSGLVLSMIFAIFIAIIAHNFSDIKNKILEKFNPKDQS